MTKRSHAALAIAAAAAMLTGGCSGLLHRDAPADQTYVLRAAARPATSAASPAADARSSSLRIGRTITAPGLDGDRVVLLRSDHRMDHFAGSRWIAPIPQMIEDLAAETLRGSGAWSSVHDSQGAFPTDYFLQLDIRRFEADYTQSEAPTVHVVLDCTLGRRADRERVVHFVAEGSAAADANRMTSVIAAFESAVQSALAIVAERSQQVLASGPPAAGGP